jgi:hypothetical protein
MPGVKALAALFFLVVAQVLGAQFSQYQYSSDDCSGDRVHSIIHVDGQCASFTNGTANIFMCEPGGRGVFSYEFTDPNCKSEAIKKENITDLFSCQIFATGSHKWECEHQV